MDRRLVKMRRWLDLWLAPIIMILAGVAVTALVLVIKERNERISSIQDSSCRWYATTGELDPKQIKTTTDAGASITDILQTYVNASNEASKEQGCPDSLSK